MRELIFNMQELVFLFSEYFQRTVTNQPTLQTANFPNTKGFKALLNWKKFEWIVQ